MEMDIIWGFYLLTVSMVEKSVSEEKNIFYQHANFLVAEG